MPGQKIKLDRSHKIKDGRVVKAEKFRSVSDKIRAGKSKKVRVKRANP